MSYIKLHPIVALVYLIVLLTATFIYSNPVYVVVLFINTIFSFAVFKKPQYVKKGIKYSVYSALLILIVNPLVSRQGDSQIFSAELFGRLKVIITLESLAYGTVMGIKVMTVVLAFMLYICLSDVDDKFSFYSKYAHRLTLTFSISLNILNRLISDTERIKNVMISRGVDFDQKNLYKRVKTFHPMLKVILLSSLEGSLDRAEALYSKGYGRGKRSTYSNLYIKTQDVVIICLSVLLGVSIVYSISTGKASFEFYPSLSSLGYGDIVYGVLFNIPVIISAFVLWRFSKCKHSE